MKYESHIIKKKNYQHVIQNMHNKLNVKKYKNKLQIF